MGQNKFQDSIVNTTSFFLHKADEVIVNLRNVLDNLMAAKNIGVGQAALPDKLKANIDDARKTINDVTASFRIITQKNSHDIRSFLHPLYYLVLMSLFFVLKLLINFRCSLHL